MAGGNRRRRTIDGRNHRQRYCRLKPLHAENRNKPTFFQSLKRHVLDPVDMFPFGLIAIITIKNTDKHQRLGDLWAKTIVVKNDTLSIQDSKF
ncbi:RDD family protein [Flavobacterium cyanobacteriorum]|uniref:RDD family protein n=1 Tax=Flavobacterium cyanobacteriorum TaxID=2022802 RepID=UPI0037430B27